MHFCGVIKTKEMKAIQLKPSTIYLVNSDTESTFFDSEFEMYSTDYDYVVWCQISIFQSFQIIPATHTAPIQVEADDKKIEISEIHVMEYESGEFISVDIEKQKEEILKALIII